MESQLSEHTSAQVKLFCEAALPQRTDSIVNAARHALERDDGIRSCASTNLEAPSAVASLRDLWPSADVTFGEIGSPDPRLPCARNAVSLWTYKSDRLWNRARGLLEVHARPAVVPPRERTSNAVARVAEMPYSRDAWREPCRNLASDVADIHELLAVMVHPPHARSRRPWDWRFHVMTAAALAIGHYVYGAPDTMSGHPLVRLLDGPVDWTTTAAVVALCDVGLRQPALVHSIVLELDSRRDREVTPVWHQCFVEPAAWATLRLMLSV